MKIRNEIDTTKSVLLSFQKSAENGFLDAAKAGRATRLTHALSKDVVINRISLSFQLRGNRRFDCCFVDRPAHQRNDLLGRVLRNVLYSSHGPFADLCDGLFAFGGAGRNFSVGFCDGLVEIGLDRCLGFVRDVLSLGPCIGERLFVGSLGLLRLGFQIFGRGNVIGNRTLPFGKDRRDARQGDAGQHEVDRDQSHEKPKDLVPESRDVELWHARRAGSGVSG